MTASEHSGEHPRLPPCGPRSWYEILDVPRTASADEIEAAYDRAVAIIDGDSIGGYMVLDPDAKASAKGEVETAFLVLSDPDMRAAFDANDHRQTEDEALARELAAAQLLDEEEWIASGPKAPKKNPSRPRRPASTPPQAAEESGANKASGSEAANDDRERARANITLLTPAPSSSEEPTLEGRDAAPNGASSNAEPTSGEGAGVRFLAPVFDDTSGPVAARSAPSEPQTNDTAVEALEVHDTEVPTEAPRRSSPSISIAALLDDASAPAERSPDTPPPLKAPRPRLTREAPLDAAAEQAATLPPSSKPLVSHIKTLPPDLAAVLVEGAEVDGEMIRRLRESRGLSLDEVASATHIRRSYLDAIEEMDIEELPARVYLRGFLTQIARVLKVDKKMLADGYLKFVGRFT